MMKKVVSIFMFLIFFQLSGQAWPNNLIFTLKPQEGIEFRKNTLGFEVIEDKSGDTFIGKFRKLNEAEVAQKRLASVGVITNMLAFFRSRSINLEEARVLSKNMNATEETTMLSGTSTRVWPGRVMSDAIKNEKSNSESNIDTPSEEVEETTKVVENEVNTSFYTIQLGVFSKTSKHKFQMEVQEKVINGKYFCFYGEFPSIDNAESELMKIKNMGYIDAFITGFDQGKKVSPSVIKEILYSL